MFSCKYVYLKTSLTSKRFAVINTQYVLGGGTLIYRVLVRVSVNTGANPPPGVRKLVVCP